MISFTGPTQQEVSSRYDWLNDINQEDIFLKGDAYRAAKRVMDLLISVGSVPLIAPLLLVCALLIKIESPRDPVLFAQERTGKGGRRFKMYKFRTMVVNAEELKKQLVPVTDKGELVKPLKLDNDPRITRVGHWLRKTSLDELPQILNIIKGEMSWVGPRPTSFGLGSYTLWHTERLNVLPGLTGLWQLYGRGDTNFDSWLRWDIRYLEKRCLWLDIQILFRTVAVVLQQKGAH